MKKFGFTLSEVMIALSLIGVIASLTIPTFISDTKNKANANKLATLVSNVENAFTSMIADEGVQDLSETAFASSPTVENLSKYLKITGSANKLEDLYGSKRPIKTISGSTKAPSTDRIFITKNGAYIIYNKSDKNHLEETIKTLGGTINGSTGFLHIDVNGKAKPNLVGRDFFWFRVGYDGLLYPAGGLNFSILSHNNNTYLWYRADYGDRCTDSSKGIGCTARLIENNYEVDY